MGKRQALAEYHRGSILAAAERLFSAHGTEGTTMDDIAREAEYSKATLYVYFQSKEEIINAIFLNGMAILRKRIQQIIREYPSWKKAYEAICEAITAFYEENPAAYGVMTGQPVSGNIELCRISQDFYRELADFLSQGAHPKLERPMETVMLFWAGISGIIYAAKQKEEILSDQIGRSREEFLSDGYQMLLRAITGDG